MGSDIYRPEGSIPLTAIDHEFHQLNQPALPTHQHPKTALYLERILKTSKMLRHRKEQTIHFSAPLINVGKQGVIFPRTINVIQGQSGVHKSRVAGLFASLLLTQEERNAMDMLGFTKAHDAAPVVCYIDTERNLSDQFPYALQCIQAGAGFSRSEHPQNYVFASLLEFSRAERFDALEEYLNHLRASYSTNIFVILDVVSDCVSDFNRTDDSMRLIDMMNQMINRFNVTFLCIIHENPNQQKARGHLGTELFNKATTVIQISMEQDGAGNPSDVVRIRFLKCRNSKCPPPIYAQIDPETKSLVEAGVGQVEGLRDSRRKKASESEVLEYLETLCINESYSKSDLIERLGQQFGASDKIVAQRLNEIIDSGRTFYIDSQPCVLEKQRSNHVSYTIRTQISNEHPQIPTG